MGVTPEGRYMPLLQVGQSTGQYGFWGDFWLSMGSALPAALLGLLWLLVVVWLLVRFRAPLSRAIASVSKRVEEGAEVSAGPVTVGRSPEIVDTGALRAEDQVAAAGGTEDEQLDTEAPSFDFGYWKRMNCGLLAPHLDFPTLVVAGPSPHCSPRTDRSIGTRDAFTVANLHATIGGAFGTSTSATVVATEEGARDLLRTERSIVSVGGPAANPLTPLLMNELSVPLRFEQGRLSAPTLGELWTPERAEGQEVVKDFVLAFGGPHPDKDEGWCTVIAAVDGAGTLHAARYLPATKWEDIAAIGDVAAGYLMVLEVVMPSRTEDRCGFRVLHLAALGPPRRATRET